MFLRPPLVVIALTALASPAFAQGITGGDLSIDVFSYSEGEDTLSINYSGALEYSINRNVGVAVDLSLYDSTVFGDDIRNVTVHGIYHLNNAASLGFFAGQDSSDDRSGTFFGLEGGFESGRFEAEGYYSQYDNDDSSTVLGFSGAYEINQSVSAIADLGFADIADDSYTRLSAGAEYEFVNGPSIYAEVGNIDGANQDSSFVGMGVNLEFGADRGTTFGRRSIWDTVKLGF